jgi:hypothetical protein
VHGCRKTINKRWVQVRNKNPNLELRFSSHLWAEVVSAGFVFPSQRDRPWHGQRNCPRDAHPIRHRTFSCQNVKAAKPLSSIYARRLSTGPVRMRSRSRSGSLGRCTCWSPSCKSGWTWRRVSTKPYRFLVSPFFRKPPFHRHRHFGHSTWAQIYSGTLTT